MKKLVLVSLVSLMSLGNAFAQVLDKSSVTKISFISSYNEYGQGDVLFKLSSPTAECQHGYWFTKNDPGFQGNLSMILAAFTSKTTVQVQGIPEKMWAGSSGKYCKVYNLNYVQ